MQNLIAWDIYEITTKSTPITGVMLRGRIRKFCLEKNRNVLTENTTDIEKSVRFAIPVGKKPDEIIEYLQTILPNVKIELVKKIFPTRYYPNSK